MNLKGVLFPFCAWLFLLGLCGLAIASERAEWSLPRSESCCLAPFSGLAPETRGEPEVNDGAEGKKTGASGVFPEVDAPTEPGPPPLTLFQTQDGKPTTVFKLFDLERGGPLNRLDMSPLTYLTLFRFQPIILVPSYSYLFADLSTGLNLLPSLEVVFKSLRERSLSMGETFSVGNSIFKPFVFQGMHSSEFKNSILLEPNAKIRVQFALQQFKPRNGMRPQKIDQLLFDSSGKTLFVLPKGDSLLDILIAYYDLLLNEEDASMPSRPPSFRYWLVPKNLLIDPPSDPKTCALAFMLLFENNADPQGYLASRKPTFHRALRLLAHALLDLHSVAPSDFSLFSQEEDDFSFRTGLGKNVQDFLAQSLEVKREQAPVLMRFFYEMGRLFFQDSFSFSDDLIPLIRKETGIRSVAEGMLARTNLFEVGSLKRYEGEIVAALIPRLIFIDRSPGAATLFFLPKEQGVDRAMNQWESVFGESFGTWLTHESEKRASIKDKLSGIPSGFSRASAIFQSA